MSCQIEYNKKTYTEEAFIEYINTHPEEFLQYSTDDDKYLQAGDTISSIASTDTISKVKEFLLRIGVDIKVLESLQTNGAKYTVNGIADSLNKLIQVVDGKEASALPEEAAHIAVSIIEQQNPTLFRQMMNEIGKYNIFQSTLSTYKDIYVRDGKPDVIKIKKEAIGKLIAENIIKINEGSTEKPELMTKAQSWWKEMLGFLKQLFVKANFNPFQEAAKGILNNTIEGEGQDDIFYQVNDDAGKNIFDKIRATSSSIQKKVKPNGDSYYALADDTEIKNRVTNRAKKFYEDTFKNKQISEQDAADNDVKKEKGTKGHSDIDHILSRYIDKQTGLLKRDSSGNLKPDSVGNYVSQIDPTNDFYNTMDMNFIKPMLAEYPISTRFMWEETIYDPNEDEAGTPDFIAIMPDGTSDVLDWKFIDAYTTRDIDVPWYKKRAFNIQLSRYGQMLRDYYDIAVQRKSRAIPMIPSYKRNKNTQELELQDIQIGDVNVKNIDKDYLLPVPSEAESTGNRRLDEFIKKLNGVISIMERKPVVGKEKFDQLKKIEELTSAIRKVQVQSETVKLIDVAQLTLEEVRIFNNTYADLYRETQGNPDLTDDEIEIISKQLLDHYETLEAYRDIEQVFVEVLDRNIPEEKEALKNLVKISSDVTYLQNKLELLAETIGERSIANRRNIRGLLSAEKSVRWLSRNFMRFSDARTKATQVLYKLINTQRQRTEIEFDDEMKKVEKIKESIETWMKGASRQKLNELIFSKTKSGKLTRSLSNKYSSEFYTGLKDAQRDKNGDWVKENIDQEAYKAWYAEAFAGFERWANDTTFSTNQGTDEQMRADRIDGFERRYDIFQHPNTAFSGANDQLMFHPQEKWYSKEYKEMLSPANAPVLALYDYMRSRNTEAHNIGLFKSYQSTFFPNVRKGFVENLVFGLNVKNAAKSIADSFTIQDNEFGFINPITGQPEDRIFARYMSDLGIKDDNGDVDYSHVSDDIFDVLTLWNYEMSKYKYLTEVESRSKLLHFLEGRKARLETNSIGKLIKEHGQLKKVTGPGANEQNTRYFKNYLDFALYGKKFAQDQDDFGFSFPYNKWADKVNKAVGMNIMPKTETPEIQMSIVKGINTMNRMFQMKTLGLNLASAISNRFGGGANAFLNSGRHITKGDMYRAQLKLTSGKLGTEGAAYAGLISYFTPLTEGPLRETRRGMTFSNTKKYLSSDSLMVLMRKADEAVQLQTAIAYFDNTMVEDGQLVNIRDYVKKQNNFDNIFNIKDASERKEAFAKIEREIEELKKTRSLPKIVKLDDENDSASLEGIERNSETVFELRNRIQSFVKDAMGNLTPEDVTQINMTLFGQSIMMFKNWIPPLLIKRYGGFRYVAGKDDYEYGRVRMIVKTLSQGIITNAGNLIGYLGGSDKAANNLIDIARTLYQQKVIEFRERGDVLDMSEAEFIDMYMKGVKAQMWELLIMMSMLGMFIAAKANPPEKDEDSRTKGIYKWSVRMIDKLTDELGFFYNPLSFESVANGKIFPSVSFLSDIVKFGQNGLKEIYYDLEGNDEAKEKNHVSKYLLKDIPVMKEIMFYLPIYNKDIADEFGIQLTTESRRN